MLKIAENSWPCFSCFIIGIIMSFSLSLKFRTDVRHFPYIKFRVEFLWPIRLINSKLLFLFLLLFENHQETKDVDLKVKYAGERKRRLRNEETRKKIQSKSVPRARHALDVNESSIFIFEIYTFFRFRVVPSSLRSSHFSTLIKLLKQFLSRFPHAAEKTTNQIAKALSFSLEKFLSLSSESLRHATTCRLQLRANRAHKRENWSGEKVFFFWIKILFITSDWSFPREEWSLRPRSTRVHNRNKLLNIYRSCIKDDFKINFHHIVLNCFATDGRTLMGDQGRERESFTEHTKKQLLVASVKSFFCEQNSAEFFFLSRLIWFHYIRRYQTSPDDVRRRLGDGTENFRVDKKFKVSSALFSNWVFSRVFVCVKCSQQQFSSFSFATWQCDFLSTRHDSFHLMMMKKIG